MSSPITPGFIPRRSMSPEKPSFLNETNELPQFSRETDSLSRHRPCPGNSVCVGTKFRVLTRHRESVTNDSLSLWISLSQLPFGKWLKKTKNLTTSDEWFKYGIQGNLSQDDVLVGLRLHEQSTLWVTNTSAMIVNCGRFLRPTEAPMNERINDRFYVALRWVR